MWSAIKVMLHQGYPRVDKNSIFKNPLYRGIFRTIIEGWKGIQGEEVDSVIDSLIEETKKIPAERD